MTMMLTTMRPIILFACILAVAFAKADGSLGLQSDERPNEGESASVTLPLTLPHQPDSIIDESTFMHESAPITLGASSYPLKYTSGGHVFDLSPLTSSPPGTHKNGPGSQSQDEYYINVGAVAGSDSACSDATVCYKYGFQSAWNPIAKLSATPAPTFALVNSADVKAGFTLTFTNGDYASGSTKPTTVLTFICQDASAPTYDVKSADGKTWKISITAKAACPHASGGGLSGGWVFVIFVLVATTVYVMGGCLYKHYRVGTQGMESCPNIDFWRKLPGLVKDGCRYFIGKCRQLVGGKSQESSEYSEFK